MFAILKPFRAGGAFYNPTDPPVDGSQFRNLQQLIDQRYIAPVEHTRRGATPDPAGEQPLPAKRREQEGTVKPSHETRADNADKIDPDAPQSKADGKGSSMSPGGRPVVDDNDDDTKDAGAQTGGDDKPPPATLGDDDKLPDDFPCNEQLAAGGVKTIGELREWLESDPREHIDGIGDKRLENITETLAKLDAGSAPARNAPTDGGTQ